MNTRNERDRHHGVNGMLPRGMPAIEFNCEMSSGHFTRMYMFRKVLNSVCEWSHSNEESGWSLMTSLIRRFWCPYEQAAGRSLREMCRSCSPCLDQVLLQSTKSR